MSMATEVLRKAERRPAKFVPQHPAEARDSGLPNADAVAVGLERTGRIVTAAAVLFSIALGAFFERPRSCSLS